MPWLTDLDDALRAGGIRFWESPGWQTRGHGSMGDIRAVLNHHTAGGSDRDWLTVQNGRPGLPGPLAQMTLERDGSVRLLAAGQCWHAGVGSHPLVGINNGNLHMIGIEGVSPGSGANAWTPAQIEAYPRVNAALLRWYRLGPERAFFHKEWAKPSGRKIDVGQWLGDANAFRDRVAQLMRAGTSSVVPSATEDEVPMWSGPIDLIPSEAGWRNFPLPVGSKSQVIAGAWVSAIVNGPDPGWVKFWFQDDDSGVNSEERTINFRDGRSDRVWAPFPDGATQVRVQYRAKQGGSLSVELKAH